MISSIEYLISCSVQKRHQYHLVGFFENFCPISILAPELFQWHILLTLKDLICDNNESNSLNKP